MSLSVKTYIKELSKDIDSIIIVSILDIFLSDDIHSLQSGLKSLGFETDIIGKKYTSFMGLINKGKIIFEFGSYNETIKFTTREDHFSIEIRNDYDNYKPESYIIINGDDVSAKSSFMNIVTLKDSAIKDSYGIHNDKGNIKMKKNHFDVALLGCWWGANYGSLLNGYAVYKILKSFDLDVLMVHKHDIEPMDWEIYNTHNSRFIEKVYPPENVSKHYTFKELYSLNDICDTFITGSDQIWNYGINRFFKFVFMLNFVNDEKKKISFGTSFGHAVDNTPKDKKEFIKNLLRRYNAISVREAFGTKMLRENYGINSKTIIEPVFCLNNKDYDELAELSELSIEEPYILCYILDPTPHKQEAIKYYTKTSGKKCIIILDGDPRVFISNKQKLNLPGILEQPEAQDFIKLFKNADFVITDSYHGTAFSIIYNKPYLAITNHKRGLHRFIELLNTFEMTSRMVADPAKIPHDEKFLNAEDYTKANTIREQLKTEAVDWLKHAIETPSDELPDIVIKNEEPAPSIHKPVRSIYKDSSSVLRFDSMFIKFRFDPTIWEQHRINGAETLFTKMDNPPARKFATLPLYTGLKKGATYLFSIKFKIRTFASFINFHIKDSRNADFQVILSYKLDNANTGNKWIELTHEFRPDSDNYNEFMLGAAQLTGPDSYISLAHINISEKK